MTSNPAGLLHHVELYVSDLAQTVAFWSWFLGELGYACVSAWDEGQSWQFGDTYIVFVQVEARFQQPAYHRCHVGLNHLAFHARSRAHVDEVTHALRARGVPILYEDRHPYAGGEDYYAVFFDDPAGIHWELAHIPRIPSLRQWRAFRAAMKAEAAAHPEWAAPPEKLAMRKLPGRKG